jgi:hypothetical protein
MMRHARRVVLFRRTNVFDHVDVRADARAASFNRLITLPLHITLQTVYSRLFSLHDMGPDVRRLCTVVPVLGSPWMPCVCVRVYCRRASQRINWMHLETSVRNAQRRRWTLA